MHSLTHSGAVVRSSSVLRSVFVIISALLFGVLFDSAPLYAQTTYYVATTGNDSNPGTQSQPFQTIQHAANLVNPGDTVLVGDGTYTATGTGSCGWEAVVCLSRGGTSSAWVTFKPMNPRGAKIDGQSNTARYGFEFQSTANYIRIDGFDVFGMGYANGDASGFVIYNGGHDVVITHNDIHDIGRLCTDTTNGETGIFIEMANVTVDSNWIHDIGRYAPGENGCSPSTDYYTNHDHGVYADGSGGLSNIMIRNNVFYNNARGWSIQVYPGSVSNLSILGNTFAYPNPYSDGHMIIGANSSNSRIIGNIFYKPTTAGIDFYSGSASNLVVANNLSTNAIGNKTPSGVSFSNNLTNTDPQMNSSFQPASTSPAVDHGQTLGDDTLDIVGVTRPQGSCSDIGAYEYAPGGGTTTQPPAPPSNLAASGTSSSTVSLTWTDNATNAGGVIVQRSLDGTTFTQVASLASTATSWGDSGLSASTKYYYRVCAYNSAGNSAYSNTASATTAAATVTLPAAPGNLAASATSSTAIALSWTDNATNASGIVVQRSLDGATFTQAASLASSATSYGDSGLNAGTTYYYRVYAYNSAGNSGYSNVASATTPVSTITPPPPPPTDTTPPAVAITSPANGATVSHWVTFQAAATDNVGVTSVRFTIDGSTIATDTSAPYSASYNCQRLSRGAHTLAAVATDAAGNTATATITVYR